MFDESNNYSNNNSNFDVYKIRENSNNAIEGLNSQIYSGMNYHNYSQNKSTIGLINICIF